MPVTEQFFTIDDTPIVAWVDELTQASTSSRHRFVIVQHLAELECCGQVAWPQDKRVAVWDSSGCGSWETANYSQCGTCGTLHMPSHGFADVDSGDQVTVLAAAIAGLLPDDLDLLDIMSSNASVHACWEWARNLLGRALTWPDNHHNKE